MDVYIIVKVYIIKLVTTVDDGAWGSGGYAKRTDISAIVGSRSFAWRA